jgi:hypothetical protein
MDQRADRNRIYFCPMHSGVQQLHSGKCPKCGMDLMRAGTRFALFRHMASNPLHLLIMATLMVAIMVAAMMMMR